jgi:hypothetical protein
MGSFDRFCHPLSDGFEGEPRELTEKLSMKQEVRPEHLGQGQDPLGVGDVSEDFALEELGENRGPLGATGGAEASALAGKSDEELESTFGTTDAGEARFELPAVEVREDGGVPVGFPESVSSLETLFPHAFEGIEVSFEELKEGALTGIPGPVRDLAGESRRRKSGAGGDAAHAG